MRWSGPGPLFCMNLPTLFDWLERLDFLRGTPAAYGILLTAVIILLTWDWRLKLLALAGQYMIAGFLFVDLLDPRLVNVKVLTGLFACLMLYMTARQVNWGKLPVDVTEEEASKLNMDRQIRVGSHLLSTSRLFRVFLTLMALVVVLTMAQRPEYQLPAVAAELSHISLAVYSLIVMGLLGAGLTSEPLQVGMAILMFLSGFELFYSALEQSVGVLASLAAVNLIVTLAISYLTQARHAIPELVD